MNIARQFNVFGRKANIPTSYAWRGYMLGQLGGLTRENYDTIARYSGDISEATRLAVQTSVEASVGVVDRAFMDEILDAEYAPEITETTERVTGYYVNQALEKQNLVNTVMLNSTRRYYEQTVGATSDALDQSLDAAQQALNAAAGGVIHGTTDFYSALRDCVRDMADHGLTGFYDKAGREWSAQAYVTMDMRTTAANAAREAAMERNREYGNELIAVSSHPGARPLCEPYQGGVYSTDGSTGETTDVHGASISYYPLELTSYGEAAGLFGINCGHYPSPFIPGLSVVRKLDISHEENERLYKESQHQRYMERRVRAAKIEADALKAAGDAEGAKAARAKARERNAELKAWCKERERAYYPERVRVTRGEKATPSGNGYKLNSDSTTTPTTTPTTASPVPVNLSNSSGNELHNPPQSGIIDSENDTMLYRLDGSDYGAYQGPRQAWIQAMSSEDIVKHYMRNDLYDEDNDAIDPSFTSLPIGTQREIIEGFEWVRRICNTSAFPRKVQLGSVKRGASGGYDRETQAITLSRSIKKKEGFRTGAHEFVHHMDNVMGIIAPRIYAEAEKQLLESGEYSKTDLFYMRLKLAGAQMDDPREILAYSVEAYAISTSNPLAIRITELFVERCDNDDE